jgi:hypothetical protein
MSELMPDELNSVITVENEIIRQDVNEGDHNDETFNFSCVNSLHANCLCELSCLFLCFLSLYFVIEKLKLQRLTGLPKLHM